MRLTLGPLPLSPLPHITHSQWANERGPALHGQLLIIRAEPMAVSEGRKGWRPPELGGESPGTRGLCLPRVGEEFSLGSDPREAEGKRW